MRSRKDAAKIVQIRAVEEIVDAKLKRHWIRPLAEKLDTSGEV